MDLDFTTLCRFALIIGAKEAKITSEMQIIRVGDASQDNFGGTGKPKRG